MIKIIHQGRLGNLLLTSAGVSIISKKYDLCVENYYFHNNFLKLHNGSKKYNKFINLNDENVFNFLETNETVDTGIIVNCLFQINNFVKKYKQDIKNIFEINNLTKNKDDLLLHIRLGDVENLNPEVEYYEYCINKINWKNGYILTDDVNHRIISFLVKKYNFKIYQNDPMSSIIFGSQFDNIILSNGTFSWWIGLLSNEKNIYYPIKEPAWHGDIYAFDEWNGVKV